MSNWVDIFIAVLLPLTAFFTVVQKRPYYALVSRGIMGVVAVLFYAAVGAPDVAITEALVGSLLTVMLFAIAVRSSLAMRVGVLEGRERPPDNAPLRTFCREQKLYLRWVSFPTEKELVAALKEGRVDAVCAKPQWAPRLDRFLPADCPPDRFSTVLAEHGRWHERKMEPTFGAGDTVVRLRLREKAGAR